MSEGTVGKRRKYIPSIDGLRALGVLAVLFYHLRLPFAGGGLVGVTLFFVLSGYLVTDLLLREEEKTGRIRLSKFWVRRVRRIAPAMILVIMFTAIASALFMPELLGKMKPDIIPSALLFNNWWQIYRDVGYFAASGVPSPLTHYWSLAIEGQFYIVWPFIVMLFARLPGGRKALFWLSLAGAVVSAILLAVFFDPSADTTRAYYGTDSRCFSLLAGSLLAMANGEEKRLTLKIPALHRIPASLAGLLGLTVILLIVGLVSGSSPFMYYGGQVLVTLGTMALLWSALQRGTFFAKLFALKPFVMVGKISYSLYLWHYPIILLISGGARSSVKITLIEIALSFALAGLGYLVVEEPFHHGAFGRIIRSFREKKKEDRALRKTAKIYAVAALAFTLCFALAVTVAPTHGKIEGPPLAKHTKMTAKEKVGKIIAEREKMEKYDFLLIGDSVALTAIDDLQEAYPKMLVDASISRMPTEAVEIYEYYKEKGWKGKGVIMALSTNGYIGDSLDELREAVGPDMPIFVVNARAPYDEYPTKNNRIIRKFVKNDPNAYLIDWYACSNDHEEYFDGDGTHMNPKGNKKYVELYKKTIDPVYKEKKKEN